MHRTTPGFFYAESGRPVERSPRSVVGYHGCHIDVARELIHCGDWRQSENDYDWLGYGVYFWEYAPWRALEWARRRFEAEAAVLAARIVLGRCLNLLDVEHSARMREVTASILSGLASRGISLPENRPGGFNSLDRFLVQAYTSRVEMATAVPISAVRGCFPEGEPLAPGSKLLNRTHVQIAVRVPSHIRGLRLVQWR